MARWFLSIARAQEKCYQDLGVEEFEVLEMLDGHTCPICGAMDGKHFPMSDYAIGVTVPPFHPNCRGTTVPYYADLEGYGERAARNANGETYFVPADTTYEQWEKSQKEFTNQENGDIISSRSSDYTIHSIEHPIEQRNTGKGNPNAILQFDVDLNNRQRFILEKLSEFDSRVVVSKKNVSMADLAALTAKTGDEFAMFTKGGERLIIRGNAVMVNIDTETAKFLADNGYRWSGHTHPGVSQNCMEASAGDYAILECFSQTTGVVYNSKGQFKIFER